jgi:hypothetical protein
MPEAARDIHDTQDLEQRVGALVGEMRTARDQGPRRVKDDDSPDEHPEQSNGDSPGLLDGPPGRGAPMPTPGQVVPPPPVPGGTRITTRPPPPSPPSKASPTQEAPTQAPDEGTTATPAPEPVAQDLAKAVEELMERSPAVQPKPPVAAPTEHIDALDAELAGLADDLIAGEFKDEAAVLKEDAAATPVTPAVRAAPAPAPQPEPLPPPSALPSQLPKAKPPATPGGEAPPPEPEPPVPAPAPAPGAPAPAVGLAPAAAPAVEPGPAPAARERAPASKSTERPAPAQRRRVTLKVTFSPVMQLLDLLSVPLKNRSQHTRDLIGWHALWVAFMAICVWAYILFRPVTPPPARAEPAPAKEPAKPGEGEHGAKKDTKTDTHASAKKPPVKKSSHAKTGEAEHH